MDSGAPVNLKKSVCRRMTAAAMRRAQVKMVLILELVAIRNCFPHSSQALRNPYSRTCGPGDDRTCALFNASHTDEDLVGFATFAWYARNLFSRLFSQQRQSRRHGRCGTGHQRRPQTSWPRGYERS